jgi:hypothetical protein
LQTLLYSQRAALIEQEAAFGHAVLDNAWSISELLNETKNATGRLAAYTAGRADRTQVQLAYEILWSRIGALDFAERVEFEGLAPLVRDYVRCSTGTMPRCSRPPRSTPPGRSR